MPRHDTEKGKGKIGELDSSEAIRVGRMTHMTVTNSMPNNVCAIHYFHPYSGNSSSVTETI